MGVIRSTLGRKHILRGSRDAEGSGVGAGCVAAGAAWSPSWANWGCLCPGQHRYWWQCGVWLLQPLRWGILRLRQILACSLLDPSSSYVKGTAALTAELRRVCLKIGELLKWQQWCLHCTRGIVLAGFAFTVSWEACMVCVALSKAVFLFVPYDEEIPLQGRVTMWRVLFV